MKLIVSRPSDLILSYPSAGPTHCALKSVLLFGAELDFYFHFRSGILFSPPPAKRWGGVGGGGSISRNRCCGERRTTPHPRPLPATRDARGGRGAHDRTSETQQ